MNGKWIFNDFVHMDTRQKEYIRKNQDPTMKNYGNTYETSAVYEQNIGSNSSNQVLCYAIGQ